MSQSARIISVKREGKNQETGDYWWRDCFELRREEKREIGVIEVSSLTEEVMEELRDGVL